MAGSENRSDHPIRRTEPLPRSAPSDAATSLSGPGDPVAPAGEPAGYSPMPGERLGDTDRFEIVEKLGAGGMGHVFRAIDRHLDRTVAIKFILQNGRLPIDQLVAMLRGEALTTAKLNHENIVAIFDMDANRGMPFLVMELLDGQSLDVMLERSRIDPLRAVQIMTQVARGLSHAHTQGIIHRDLKPSNVFVLRNGRPKILDFGIAVLASAVGTGQPSETGRGVMRWGTPSFMAPEQLRGDPQDARVDIWAAGVMLYQMLTGRLPFTIPELLERYQTLTRTHQLAPSVRLLVPALPDEADRLVATALSEDPQGRFQTARELMEALRELESVMAGRSSDARAASSAKQIERRPLTLLACHLNSSDQLDVEDDVDAEQRVFYEAAADAVKRAEGSIGMPFGGTFVCCFGYPAAKGTDARRAVWAALQIAQAMREHAQKSGTAANFTIAVHSGLVALPSRPSPGQSIPAMSGHVPNLAGKLAETAPRGTIVTSQATFELTRHFFQTQPLTATDGGEKSATAVYQVLGELEGAGHFEHADAPQLTPFVGRDAERSELRRLWDETKQGRGGLAVVTGDPGIGKSRLVQTLKDTVIEEHNIRLTCQCRPHFKNGALHPIIELILRSMNIRRTDSAAEKLHKLEINLTSLAFAPRDAVPLFAALLSIPFEPAYAPLGLPPEQQKMKTLEGLVSMLLATAQNRPTLFIIEDMHWADHSTIEFLTALIDRLPSSRVLVVLTSRPEFHVPWSARAHLHQMALDRLSPVNTLSMIEHASKDRGLSPEIVDRLVATTDGVPLFVEELTRMIVESRQPADPEQTSIPGTLQELLLAKLDLLRPIGKQVAQVASILGRDFHYELLRYVSPFDEMSLQEGLEILANADILHSQGDPPDSRYVFKHALIQQAAYQSLMKSDRQRHHRRAAEVLSDVFTETAEEQPELLAHHHSEAGNQTQAIAFWEKAGQRAAARSAMVEAINQYTRAREALKAEPEGPERDRRELALLLALGSPLMSVRGYANPEVESTYARARELARAAGGHAEIFPAMQGLWQFYYVRGMLPASRELGRQLLEIARESGSSTFLLLAHRSVASSAFLQGDYETCRTHTQAGIAIYNLDEHRSLALRAGQDPGVAHGVYLAWSLWMLGYPDQSLARVTEAVELAKRLDHPMTIAYALCFQALMRNHRGDHAEAERCSAAALDITTPNRFSLWTAWAQMQRGWALSGMGDFERGIPLMIEGLDGWKSTGARVGFTFFPVTLAEIYLHTGQYAEAARLLDEAAPMIANNDEHFFEPELLRLKGELALALGQDDASAAEARGHFNRGIEVARALSGRSWQLRLATSRARLEAARGSAELGQATDALRHAYGWFTEGFETADLRAARAELERLAARGPCER